MMYISVPSISFKCKVTVFWPDDKYYIMNVLTPRTANTDGIIHKPVMVFAFTLLLRCFVIQDKSDPAPASDRAQCILTSNLPSSIIVTRHCITQKTCTDCKNTPYSRTDAYWLKFRPCPDASSSSLRNCPPGR